MLFSMLMDLIPSVYSAIKYLEMQCKQHQIAFNGSLCTITVPFELKNICTKIYVRERTMIKCEH